MKILYSQCWEDARVLSQGLRVTPDDNILSIASGGDNSFALLLKNPRSVIAIDQHPGQIYLVELKIAAIKYLDYTQFIQFMGVRPKSNRWDIYIKLRPFLSERAADYWNNKKNDINRGIIHIGKFENYFALFYRLILPLIHRRRTINRFLSESNQSVQINSYNQTWNNIRWRYLFKIFFSRFVLSRFGRSAEYFRYVAIENISKVLFKRTEYGLTGIPVKDNFYVEYILSGKYRNLHSVPLYLNPDNFEIIKKRIDRIKLVCSNLEEYLNKVTVNTISKFNLSDCFEYMSRDQIDALLKQIVKIARPKARLAFWTLFIPQSIPKKLYNHIESLSEISEKLSSTAQTFFYNDFCLWQIRRS
ncbi:MAG: DUF3419 family protein [candidate division Zixibacteria bacterium]|nr:DUF3419 family protein [candidate division Zixibacteria bacterium]